MKDISDIFNDLEDQERGAELELRDPVNGTPTGLKITFVGPDSATHRRSRLQMSDELSDLARSDGTIGAEERERVAIGALARLALRWNMIENDKPVPFNHANLLRVLSVAWVREQADAFAGNRANFRADRV